MMKLTKRVISLLLALTMVLTICLSLFPASAQAASFAGLTGPTLVKRDGTWYYVKNGTVCYDRTLVKYGGAWWIVKIRNSLMNQVSLRNTVDYFCCHDFDRRNTPVSWKLYRCI